MLYHWASASGTSYESFFNISHPTWWSNTIQTLDLMIISWVLYHYAMATGVSYKSFWGTFSSWFQCRDSNPRSQDCTTTMPWPLAEHINLFAFSLSWFKWQDSKPWSQHCCLSDVPLKLQPLAHLMNLFWHFVIPAPVMGLKPSILGLWVECSTTVLWQLAHLMYLFSTFHYHGSSGRNKTLNLGIMS